MHIKIKCVTIIFIICCILRMERALEAGIGVDPTITEIVVDPGTVTKGVYKVVNDGDEPVHVKAEAEDWLKARTGASDTPIEAWLTITPVEFDIEPQGIKEVEYIIAPPSGAEGELVAMIFFASSSAEGALSITTRFGVSIYAAIKETIKAECNITNVTVRRKIEQRKESGTVDKGVDFVIEVENKGNVHLRPTGDIAIRGEGGKQYNVNIKRGFPVFPGKRLEYAVNWDKKDLSPGKYEALIRLDYGNIYNINKTVERRMTFTVKKDGKISF